MRAAQLIQRDAPEPDNFAPLPGWGSGVILIDRSRRPIAIDTEASLIFQQLAVLDGVSANAFALPQSRDALEYVALTLKSIFHELDGHMSTIAATVSRVYLHWTRIILKLRGVLIVGADRRQYVTVLVERGETLEFRRRLLFARWGLSQREAEILSLLADSRTGPKISMLLHISHDTVRKHMGHIFEKLGVETRLASSLDCAGISHCIAGLTELLKCWRIGALPPR